MDLSSQTKPVLISKCRELGIRNYSTKPKKELIELLETYYKNNTQTQNEQPIVENVSSSGYINEIVSQVPTTISSNSTSTSVRFIDLFCGIGGFHQAMHRIGGKCVFACDVDANCRKTYETNYGVKPHGDITSIDIHAIPEFDVLCAGFPCQSFSNSGKKKGLSDKRGQLFEYILQIADFRKPRFLFLENVKHIQNIEDGKVFTHILNRIRETGYSVDTMELSPHQLGIPQQRERIVFICVRNDMYIGNISKQFKIPNVAIDVKRIFETDTEKTNKYKISQNDENILKAWDEMIQLFQTGESMSPTILCNEFYTTYTNDEFLLLPDWKKEYITKNRPLYIKYKDQWDKWYEKHRELITRKEIYGKLEWQAGKKKENDSIFNQFIQFRQSGIRVKKCEYFPTLVAIVQTPIYAKEKRYITPRECARLQSFPDNFILHENDHTAYKQFGNAVNVDVVHFVIYNTLKMYNIIV